MTSPLDPWHNDATLEFLELYKRERVLWDRKDSNYKNAAEAKSAWGRIQASMSMNYDYSLVDIRRKKESLFATYRQNLRKKQKKAGKWQPCWFAYDLMDSFLNDRLRDRYDSDSDDETQLKQEAHSSDDYEYAPSSSKNRLSLSKKRKNVPVPTKADYNKIQTNVTGSYYIKNTDDKINTSFNYLEKHEVDDCELYGNLLARKLRKLDEDDREIVMHEIDNIMYKAAIRNRNAQNTHNLSYNIPRKLNSPLFVNSENNEDYEEVTYLEESIHNNESSNQ